MFSDTPQFVTYNETNHVRLLPSSDQRYIIHVTYSMKISENVTYELYIAGRPYSNLEHTVRMDFVLHTVCANNRFFEGVGFANFVRSPENRTLFGRKNEWFGECIRYMYPGGKLTAFVVFDNIPS